MRLRLALIVIVMMCTLGVPVQAQVFGSPGQQTAVKKSQNPSPFGYWEYLPQGYSHTAAQKFGLMIFLHGAGERGDGETQLNRLLQAGGGWPTSLIANNGKQYPVIVLSPQCSVGPQNGPHTECGGGAWDAATIETFIRYAMARYNVDLTRVYVTGLSRGGAGTVGVARRMPSEIAAIVPICMAGGGVADDVNLRQMPMWVTHAVDDTTVNIGESRYFLNGVIEGPTNIMTGYDYATETVQDQLFLYRKSTQSFAWSKQTSIADLSPDLPQRFTTYKDGNHGIWARTYADANIMNWLLAQQLGTGPVLDTTPDAFTFPSQTNVVQSTGIASASVTPTGFNTATAVTVSNGEYSLQCNGAFTAAPGSISPGQVVCVRHTSAATASTTVTTTLVIGGVGGGFSSTTAALAPTITLQSAVSRKVHGGTITYDLPISLSGSATAGASVTVEPRQAGAGGAHALVLRYSGVVSGLQATVTAGVATVGTPVINSAEVTLPLTGVSDATRLGLSIVVQVGGVTMPAQALAIGFLRGDVMESGKVDATDLSAIKALSRYPVDANTFRFDVNLSGKMNAADILMVKANLARVLP
jgi:poly(3-hydroxybutyrate) depolymerase